MANIITATNVFEFIGTDANQRDTQLNAINSLITREQAELERTLNRKITSQTASSLVLKHGHNVYIHKDKLYLKGNLVDFYSITALSEEGTSLDAVAAYNDSNDYVFDAYSGIITRVSGKDWSTSDYALVISGKYGYVNSDDTVKKDVEQLLIEIVAMRSGLWKKTFVSEGGTVETQKDKDVYLQNKIASHINYSLV